MRILMLNMQSSGVGDYRHWSPARALKRAGYDVTHFETDAYNDTAFTAISQHPRGLEQRLTDLAFTHDIIHTGFSTVLSHVETLVALRELSQKPFITDIDDNTYAVPTYNIAFASYHQAAQERKIVRLQLRVSDGVSVTVPTLRDSITHDCKRISILPNYHDPYLWHGLQVDPRRDEDKSVRFMFAGGVGRYGDLVEVQEAFEWAMAKFPQLRLLFMGVVPDWAAKYMPSTTDPCANRAFSIRHSSYPNYRPILKWLSPDVFFSPVVENTFNASKSHIKAYDAAECGAAFLCTDYTTYKEVPNNAAIKVRGTYEWKEAIEQLIVDAPLRKRLNTRLLEWSRDEWAIDSHIDKWVSYYRDIVSAGPVRTIDDIVRSSPHVHSC